MNEDYLHEGDPDFGWEFVCEDFVFARLDEEHSAAKELDGKPRLAAFDRVAALRRIAAWHTTYVDREGRSAARCFTCSPSYGFPCTTLRGLAAIWRGHTDYLTGWTDTSDFLADEIREGGFRRAYLARRGAA